MSCRALLCRCCYFSLSAFWCNIARYGAVVDYWSLLVMQAAAKSRLLLVEARVVVVVGGASCALTSRPSWEKSTRRLTPASTFRTTVVFTWLCVPFLGAVCFQQMTESQPMLICSRTSSTTTEKIICTLLAFAILRRRCRSERQRHPYEGKAVAVDLVALATHRRLLVVLECLQEISGTPQGPCLRASFS